MQITAEPIEPRQVQLEVVVPPERIAQAMDDAAQLYARRLRIPGYRPGKAPRRLVAAHVGEEALREAALKLLQEQIPREALHAEELIPAGPVILEVTEEEPLTYRLLVPLEPEVILPDVQDLRIAAPEPRLILDEDVDAVIDRWRQDLAYLAPVDRPAQAGDVVALSLVGRDGDKVVYEDDALTLELSEQGLPAANLPNGIQDQIVGHQAGETFEFTWHYSEFWPQPELQGREVTFQADLTGVSAMAVPELDDALADELAGLETLDELRARVREQLQTRAEIEALEALVDSQVEALVAGSDVRYPPVLLDQEVALLLSDLRTRVEQQGFSWERWLELQGKDEEALWAEVEPEAEARLRANLVLAAFTRAEGIRISDQDIEAALQRMQGQLASVSRHELPPREELRQRTVSRLLSSRIFERLLELAEPRAVAGVAGAEAQTTSPVEDVIGSVAEAVGVPN